MSIFDVFTFKAEATKVFSKENFAHILETARAEIIKQAKEKYLGQEKKDKVDAIVIKQIEILKDTYKKNKLITWLLDQIIKTIPTVTQLIYEFLKEKVDNL